MLASPSTHLESDPPALGNPPRVTLLGNCSRSRTVVASRAVTTPLYPRSRTALARWRPRPGEHPVINHVGMCISPLPLAGLVFAVFLVIVSVRASGGVGSPQGVLRSSSMNDGNRTPVSLQLVVNEVFDGFCLTGRCSSLPDFRARDMMLPPNAERALRLEGAANVEVDR